MDGLVPNGQVEQALVRTARSDQLQPDGQATVGNRARQADRRDPGQAGRYGQQVGTVHRHRIVDARAVRESAGGRRRHHDQVANAEGCVELGGRSRPGLPRGMEQLGSPCARERERADQQPPLDLGAESRRALQAACVLEAGVRVARRGWPEAHAVEAREVAGRFRAGDDVVRRERRIGPAARTTQLDLDQLGAEPHELVERGLEAGRDFGLEAALLY